MRKINERYTRETYDEDGLLKTYRLEYPENYNFGYDIVDDIAVNDPDRVAMYWDSVKAPAKKFTFADIKRMSDKTANFLAGLGI